MENYSMEIRGKRNHDFPHETLMDELQINVTHLPAALQRKVREFDNLYLDKILDGIITEQENDELISNSYQIAQDIKSELQVQENESGGISPIGVVSVLALAVGAIFGIRKLIQ